MTRVVEGEAVSSPLRAAYDATFEACEQAVHEKKAVEEAAGRVYDADLRFMFELVQPGAKPEVAIQKFVGQVPAGHRRTVQLTGFDGSVVAGVIVDERVY